MTAAYEPVEFKGTCAAFRRLESSGYERHDDEDNHILRQHVTCTHSDIRTERLLNELYGDESGPPVIRIASHGRTINSIFRILGCDFDEREFRSLDLDHVVVIARRSARSPQEQAAKLPQNLEVVPRELACNEREYLGLVLLGFAMYQGWLHFKTGVSQKEAHWVASVKKILEKQTKHGRLLVLRRAADKRLEFAKMSVKGTFTGIAGLTDLL